MSRFLPKSVKKYVAPEPVDMIGDYTKLYAAKTRFGMLGPVSSGKSTIAAGIVYTCETLSSLLPDFFCRVLPTSTHILNDANNLRLGRFPKKTDPYAPRKPEAGLLICKRKWREKKVQVPICDVAGEITDYIHEKAEGFTPSEVIKKRARSINQAVVKAVRDCQGFILAMAASEALMFRKDPTTVDPDVYLYTVLNDIFEYRRRNRRPDPHIIAVLTKWDKVMKEAKDIEMDVYDSQDGLQRFLDNGFPATSMLLKPLVDKKLVKYFRSWFSIKKREDGSDMMWPDTNKPVIDLCEKEGDHIRFRPKCSEEDYIELVHYIGSFGQ